MSPRRKLFNFVIDEDLAEGLKLVKERDGISEAEQARRAIRNWLESKAALKAAHRRVQPRRKA